MRRLALFAAVLALAACDRAPLDPGDVRVEVVSPDLGRAQASGLVTLDLRVSSAPPGATVTVDGQPAAFSEARGLYTVAVGLLPGLNALAVEATANDALVLRDTVYALRLDVRPVPVALPEVPPRAGASATPLPDGATLLAGGIGPTGALATTTRFEPDGAVTSGTLTTTRAGHTATRLPLGEILLLGGATTLDPAQASQFVSTAEILSPDGGSVTVPIEGGAFLRTGHTTRLLVTASGRTVLYVYGGRDASAGVIAPTGTVAILEWLPEGRLVRLSPPLGAGAFPATEFHAQLDLPGDRAVTLGGEPPDGDASRFTWSEPGVNFPFDMRRAAAAPLPTPRRAAAVVALGGDLWLVAGGETVDGETSDAVEVYAPGAGRAFRLGPEATLARPRAHASAAILPGARIAIVGGVGPDGLVIDRPEPFSF